MEHHRKMIFMGVSGIALMIVFIIVGTKVFDFNTNITATIIYFTIIVSILVISIIIVAYQTYKIYKNDPNDPYNYETNPLIV